MLAFGMIATGIALFVFGACAGWEAAKRHRPGRDPPAHRTNP